MARKGGLGKGLDSLISDKRVAEVNKEAPVQEIQKKSEGSDEKQVMMVHLSEIEPNQGQPRKSFDSDSLEELADSIRKFGVLQPLLVQKKKKYYEIIAGERRWRAAKLAGVEEVPVIVKKLSDQEKMEISLIENIQREDLNPIEEAQAYRKLIDEFGMKQEELAEEVSKSRSAITNSLRLLKLDKKVQKMLEEGKISSGHARALLSVDNSEEQVKIAQLIVDKNLSVRDVENMLKKKPAKEKPKTPETAQSLAFRQVEDRLQELYGTKVAIQNKKSGKGKIEISYYSQDELERILEMLQK